LPFWSPDISSVCWITKEKKKKKIRTTKEEPKENSSLMYLDIAKLLLKKQYQWPYPSTEMQWNRNKDLLLKVCQNPDLNINQ